MCKIYCLRVLPIRVLRIYVYGIEFSMLSTIVSIGRGIALSARRKNCIAASRVRWASADLNEELYMLNKNQFISNTNS